MNNKQLLLVIGVWLIGIVGLLVYKQMIFWTGTEVVLRTVPVDPWDLFRGEYVILRYEISEAVRVDSERIEFDYGDDVYVSLVKDRFGIGGIKSVSKLRPKNGELYIKGVVGYRGVEYGIESYFVEQGRGRDIENMRSQDLLVRIVVDKQGRAVIKNLEFEGNKI